ncbi:MAG: RsbRD N-terminal domain-containing protein [Betaproteobacteria bacterium]|nr:RsbRD N-terminal domain-containing protein [Betaproteobacteria bacterium]
MNKNEVFAGFCRSEQEQILAEWNEAVFATYPLSTAGFARTKEDQFRNPGGHAVHLALEETYKAVSGQASSEELLRSSLEMFVKLRAVQDFTPIQALGVIYLLKPLLRERILPACLQNGLLDDYLEAESRLDTAALLACDIYVASKKRVLEERIGEIKRQHTQLVRWAQKKGDGPSE